MGSFENVDATHAPVDPKEDMKKVFCETFCTAANDTSEPLNGENNSKGVIGALWTIIISIFDFVIWAINNEFKFVFLAIFMFLLLRWKMPNIFSIERIHKDNVSIVKWCIEKIVGVKYKQLADSMKVLLC